MYRAPPPRQDRSAAAVMISWSEFNRTVRRGSRLRDPRRAGFAGPGGSLPPGRSVLPVLEDAGLGHRVEAVGSLLQGGGGVHGELVDVRRELVVAGEHVVEGH